MSQSSKHKEIVLNALRNYRNALNNQIDLFTDDEIEALKIPHIDEIVAIYGEASLYETIRDLSESMLNEDITKYSRKKENNELFR